MEEFQTVLRLMPNSVAAHNNLGLVFRDKGDVPRAIAEFRTAIQLEPTQAKAHFNLAFMLKRQGDLQSALTEYRIAIDLDPSHADAHGNLANTLDELGQLKEAMEEYRVALQLNPRLAEARNGMAILMYKQGDVRGAIKELQAVLELTPNDIHVHLNLGTFHYSAGDLGAALDRYRRAATLNPGNPHALKGVSYVEERLRQGGIALEEQEHKKQKEAARQRAEAEREPGAAEARRRAEGPQSLYVDAELAPQRKTGQIKLHGPAAFAGMRKVGRLAAECLDMLTKEIVPGVSGEKLDRRVMEFALDHGASPALLNYRGYPCATCISVNHVVCHGVPSPKELCEGDILSVCTTFVVDGWNARSTRMFTVEEVAARAEKLIAVAYEAMMRDVSLVKPGATTGDIGNAIQSFVEAQHMSVVREYSGSGIGRILHDDPSIVHVGKPREGRVLRPGMFFTIQPMINLGHPHVKVLSDGWTAVTRDRSLSAEYGHTLAVSETGVEIFT